MASSLPGEFISLVDKSLSKVFTNREILVPLLSGNLRRAVEGEIPHHR